jgi:4a-hydroxytetrahydrobiopterin dehydratase
MSTLAQTECEPCRGGMPPLDAEGIAPMMELLHDDWSAIEDHHLLRQWTTPDFASALALVNRIGALAETAGHHPDVHLGWGWVRIELWTHKIDGLHLADFVLAAQIDELHQP